MMMESEEIEALCLGCSLPSRPCVEHVTRDWGPPGLPVCSQGSARYSVLLLPEVGVNLNTQHQHISQILPALSCLWDLQHLLRPATLSPPPPFPEVD